MGGAISYVELPNMYDNLEALESVIQYMYNNIRYAEFNTKSDYCTECGHEGEILINEDNQWECPMCHTKMTYTGQAVEPGKPDKQLIIVRRACGYLGAELFNYGKTIEIKNRVTHL